MSDTGTLTITDFLLARIGEDEVRGRILAERRQNRRQWSEETWDGAQSDYPDSPARVLAECAAKRAIVELDCTGRLGSLDMETAYEIAHEETLKLLAQPYADHPDFREEWRQ